MDDGGVDVNVDDVGDGVFVVGRCVLCVVCCVLSSVYGLSVVC